MSMLDNSHLRVWQREALEAYRTTNRRDFSVTATPGAGKTRMALSLAQKLLSVGQAQQIVVVAPTDHLRTQWAQDAGEAGIFLDPTLSSRAAGVSADYVGYVTTYAQVAINPAVHHNRVTKVRTLVIFDEIHHAGDGLTWGDAVKNAFNGAHRRLCLTGTPFRTSLSSTIPFMHYKQNPDGYLVSSTDYDYGYAEALKDGVVRPVTFAAYSADTSWEDSAGDVVSAGLSEDSMSAEIERLALKAALDPKGSWVPHVFESAHKQLLLTRTRGGMPDAGGLVLASDQSNAQEYAKIMEKVSGQVPTIVVSDDPKASSKIDQFKSNPSALWMIAVRMVSEGVDVPRLAVGVWATNYKTPLFFAQAIGRFVRSRAAHEHATVFLPATRSLLALAAEMEAKRKHVISTQEEDFDDMEDPIIGSEELQEERALNSVTTIGSQASFDHVLFNGRAIDGLSHTLTPEEVDYVGLPGLLSSEELAELLRQRDQEIRLSTAPQNVKTGEPRRNVHAEVLAARRDINRLVSRIANTRGVSHAHVHKLSQGAVKGKPSAQATLDILEKRREWLQKTAGGV